MADRGQRFTGRTQLGTQNLGSGAESGLMQLAGKFQQFSDEAGAARREKVSKESFREGQGALIEGEKPQFKKERFIGGVKSEAFNAGLRNAYLAGVANDARENLNRIESENPTDVAAYDESAAAYMNAVLSEADPVSLPAVKQGLEKSISQGSVRVQNAGFAAQAKAAKIASDQAWSGFANDAARFARNGDVDSASDAFSSMQEITLGQVESGQISREAGEKRIRDTRQEIKEQELKRSIGEVVATEGVESAASQLEALSGTVPAGWEPDDWDSFIKSARADLVQADTDAKRKSTELSIEESRVVSNLKIQSRTGTGNAGDIVSQADQLFDSGKISESERTSIITNVINGQKDVVKKAESFQSVVDRINGDASVVLDQKQVDEYYKEALAPNLSDDPTQRELQMAEYVHQTRTVPAGMKLEINNFLRSGDSGLVAQASKLIDRVDDIPGLVDGTFSATDKAFASQVVGLMSNLEPEEAVRVATELTDPTNQPAIDARTKTIKDKKFSDNYSDIVRDEFNPFGPFSGTGVNENTVDQMTQEYKSSFESYFKAGMRKDAAKEKALQDLNRNWSTSAVTNKTMKYSPDEYYSINGSVEYIKDQLLDDVTKEFIFDQPVTTDQIELQATEETARTASQGAPVYRVIVVNEDGIQPLYGFTWSPDMNAEIDRVSKMNQAEIIKERQEAQRGLDEEAEKALLNIK